MGDRVMAGTRFGGYSERVAAKADDVAAAARRALVRAGRGRPGELPDRIPRAASGSARWSRASGCSCTPPPAAWASPPPRSPRPAAPRSTARASPGKHDAIRGFGVRPRPRLHAARLGEGAAADGPGHGCDRRPELSGAATTCCAPAAGWCASALQRSCRARSATWPRPAAPALRDAALQPDQADVGVQVGDRAEHAHAVGRARARSSDYIGDARADDRPTGPSKPIVAESFHVRPRRPRHTASSASAATSARSC